MSLKFIADDSQQPPRFYIEDGGGTRIELPEAFSWQTTMPREETAIIGASTIVSRELEPAAVTIKFRGGCITLEQPRRDWHT